MGDAKAAKDVATPEAIIAAPEPKTPGVEKRDGSVSAPARTMRTPVSTGGEPGRARTMRALSGSAPGRAAAVQLPGSAPAPAVSRPDEPAEREAAAVARQVAAGEPARPAGPGPAGLGRLTRTGVPPPDATPAVSAAPAPAAAGAPTRLPHGTAAAVGSRDPGAPIRSDVRRVLEARMAEDLADVRVHESPESQEAARAIDARAFTRAGHVWLGPGESQDDIELMAHEVAHVVQGRDDAAQASRLARTTSGVAPAAQGTPGLLDDGEYELGKTKVKKGKAKVDPSAGTDAGKAKVSGNVIEFPSLPIPPFKTTGTDKRKAAYAPWGPGGKSIRRGRKYSDAHTGAHRAQWDKKYSAPTRTALKAKAEAKNLEPQGNLAFQLGSGGSPTMFFAGSLEDLARELTVPSWTPPTAPLVPKSYQLDHIVELQISEGFKSPEEVNAVDNLELLAGSVNSRLGNAIKNAIDDRVRLLIAASGKGVKPKDVKDTYDLVFQKPAPGPTVEATKEDVWETDLIEKGKHIDPLTIAESPTSGTKVKVLPPRGVALEVTRPDEKPTADEERLLWPYTVIKKDWKGTSGATSPEQKGERVLGSILLQLLNKKTGLPTDTSGPVEIHSVQGSDNLGVLRRDNLLARFKGMRFPGLSLVEIDDVEVTGRGLLLAGRINVTLPIFAAGTTIDLTIDADSVTLSKSFDGPDFSLPKPFMVSGSSLTIAVTYGGQGLGGRVDGQVDFGIDKVGSGWLKAGFGTTTGFTMEGRFDFDPRLFDGFIALRYANGKISGEGKATLKKDAIPGVKSATIGASYKEGVFKADGAAELDVPGVKSGKLSLVHSEAEGLQMSGDFELSNDLPGIRSGTVHAKAVQHPDGTGYDLVMTGTAVTALPGLTAALAVTYERGSFTVEASGAYKHGMLDGTVLVGVTNRPIGSDNRPLPAPTTPVVPAPTKLRAYGGGSVGVTLTPWLRGVVGVVVRENGEIVVSGEIGIPAPLDVFPRKDLDKRLVDVSLDFPIAGFAVAGARVGVFGTVGGSLDLIAFLGPGQLRQAKLALTYNPSREEDTTVTGTAQFAVPAFAGLRLGVNIGIGVGAAVISATGGLELAGMLGVGGEAAANVTIRWTPTSGLSLDAEGRLSAEPSFSIDLTGFVRVDVDLWFWSATLWEQRWKLAGMKWGSGMTVGARFPIHYVEGKPFDIALSDIEFIYPTIDPKAVLAGVIDSTKESTE